MKYTEFLDHPEEEQIKKIIEESDNKHLHSVLVCDIDDYRNVKEQIGADNALILMERAYKKLALLFRSDDIVVNLRGDEFIVFNRNIGNLINLEYLARKIQRTLFDIDTGCDIRFTASIGCSIFPFHGSDYTELKNKAYQAMIRAKSNGKNGFRLYDSARTKSMHRDYVASNGEYNPRDLDVFFQFGENKSYQQICTEMFQENIDGISALNSILELSCLYFGFSRAYLYIKDAPDIETKKRLCYANNGFEFTPDSPIMAIIREDAIARMSDRYKTLSLLNRDDENVPSEIRDFMGDQGAIQFLFYPVIWKDEIRGAAVFENLENGLIDMPQEQLTSLYEQMKSIQSYYYQTVYEKDRDVVLSRLNLFENIDACVYIIDADSYMVEFANEKAKRVDGENKVFDKCYKIFLDRDKACEDCPLAGMDRNDTHANASKTIFNYSTGKYCKNLYSWVDANSNKGKSLMISVDVDELIAGGDA